VTQIWLPAAPRLAGAHRYATSVAISGHYQYLPGLPAAYIRTGVNYPDVLGAAPVVSALGGPVLLTAPTALLDNIGDELVRLRPALIVVVGGRWSVV